MTDQAFGRFEEGLKLETPEGFRNSFMERVEIKPQVFPLETVHTAEAIVSLFERIGTLIKRLPDEYQAALLDTPKHWNGESHPAWALMQGRSVNT